MLDAIALAGGEQGTLKSVVILRQEFKNSSGRKLQISGSQLLAGDRSLNVFVRPGDTIIVTATGAPLHLPVPKAFA